MTITADIDIIIPTYNRAGLLRYTLDSLRQDLHPGVKTGIIVVDDGSTDDTSAIVRQFYPEVTFLANKGKGAASARNTGLKAATADFVVYLDSDDLIGAGFFNKKVEYLRQHTGTDICYGNEVLFEGNGSFQDGKKLFKNVYPVVESETAVATHYREYLSGHYIHPSAIVWRRKLLLELGGHDESLMINQDVELFIRALFRGVKVMGIEDGTTVYTRQHTTDDRVGSAGTSNVKWLQILALREKIYQQMKAKGINDESYYRALSFYLFRHWKKIRHWDKETAEQYLSLAKKVHWPVELTGNAGIKFMGRLLGPDNMVRLKYFVMKRD
jgi:glycosyltransferase involved in cell wall biosynthesis